MSTSGVWVRDVTVVVTCDECDWAGVIETQVDPEDRLGGMDIAWRCPACLTEHTEPEGTW